MTAPVEKEVFRFERGEVRIARWPSFEFGSPLNAETLDIDPQLEEHELADYQSKSGGTAAYLALIKSAKATIKYSNLTPQVLAAAMSGNVLTQAAAPVVDTVVVGTLGMLRPFSRLPSGEVIVTKSAAPLPVAPAHAISHAYAIGDLVTPVPANGRYYRATTAGTSDSLSPVWPSTTGSTVTDGLVGGVDWVDMGVLPAALVRGTDYHLAGHGGIIPLTGGAIAAGDTVYLHYTAAETLTYDALMTSGQDYRVMVTGFDVYRGKKISVMLHKMRFNPSKRSLLSKEFNTVEIGSMLQRDADMTPTAADIASGRADVSMYYAVQEEV